MKQKTIEDAIKFVLKFSTEVVKLSGGAKNIRMQCQFRYGIFGDSDDTNAKKIKELGPGYLIVADWHKGNKHEECSVYFEL